MYRKTDLSLFCASLLIIFLISCGGGGGGGATPVIPKVWHHPASLTDNVSTDGQGVSAPQTAIDDGGNTVVVWKQDYSFLPACGNGGLSPCIGIFKSDYRNGVWTHPTTTADHISPAGFMADSPSVAMDRNGNALIVWRQFDASFACAGDCPSAYMSEYRAGSWSTPTAAGVLAGTNQYAFDPRAAMDDNGNAIIVWRHSYSSVDGIFKSEYRSGVWTKPTSTTQRISPSGPMPQFPQVAMDNNGNALIVWQQSDGAFTQIYKSEYRSGVWTHPTNTADHISPGGRNAANPQVAMDNNGNAIITWSQSNGVNDQIYKREYRSSAWLSAPTISSHISPTGQPASAPQVAMDNNGNAIIAWMQLDDTTASAVFKSEYRSGGWTHPSGLADNISQASRNLSGLRLSMDDNGNALLVWSQNDEMGNSSTWIVIPPMPPPGIQLWTYNYLQIYKAEYRNGAWTLPSALTDNISIDGQPADSPAVAMGNNGDAIIVQSQRAGAFPQIFKSEYR